MHCRRSSETSVNKLLNDGHALMALSSSPKPIIVKAGNQFSGYVSNYTHNQKYKKNNLCVYFNRKLLHFQSQGV